MLVLVQGMEGILVIVPLSDQTLGLDFLYCLYFCTVIHFGLVFGHYSIYILT